MTDKRNMEQAPTCECMTCTCTGCHEECFGHCHGCGKPVRSCNSFQTEGEKNLVRPADAGGSKLYLKKDSPLVYRFGGTGQFQFWLFSGKQEWKPSDFLNQTYARENRENLKPPSQWLDEYAAAHGFREITQKEFDAMCKNMNAPTAVAAATTEGPAAEVEETLTTSESAEGAKTSQDMKSGPSSAASSSGLRSLADTVPATQSLSDAGAACLEAEPERLDFDYSGMSARTVDTLHVAERMIREARRDYVITVAQAVGIVHEELCGGVVQNLHNSKHGNRGDDTFGAWCASVGIGRRSAYNLLQVNALMQGATPEEQAMLEQASPSLLYAAAKPSAPAELVQAVKEGSITTHKQYQELLKENQQLRTDRVNTMNRAKAAEDRAQAAEAQRDAALADVDGLSQQNARLQSELKASEESAAEKDARIRELESPPVEVVGATPQDIARWRAEVAEQACREAQKELRRISAEAAKERKRADEAERDRDAYADTMEKYATQLGELRSQQEIDPEDAERMSFIANSIENSRNLLVQALDRAEFLPNGLCAKAMALLADHGRSVLRASEIQCWPTRPEDFEDEPDEWPEDEEDDADV